VLKRTEKPSSPFQLDRGIVSGNSMSPAVAYKLFTDSSRFALKEMRLILATLLRRFELLLVPNQSHELRAHFIIPYFKSGEYLVEVKACD
jgi:hypothetical protein